MTRILHIHFGKEGGAERFFVSLCQALHDRGIEQQFIIRPGRSWLSDIQHLGTVHQVYYPRLWAVRQFLSAWVRRIESKWRPNAIIAWMPKAATLIPAKSNATRLTRLGDYPRHIEHFENCDCMITNTPDIPNRLRDLGWNKPVEVISNFPRAQTPNSTPPELNLKNVSFIVGGVGRFVKLKGFDILMRAVALLPDVGLCLVGDGEERKHLEMLADELGISDRVVMTGWVSDPTRWLAACDVACVTSTHETLGNVVLEAWDSQIPVISTPTPGPSWLLADQKSGLLLEGFSHENLAAGIANASRRTRIKTRAGCQWRVPGTDAGDTLPSGLLMRFCAPDPPGLGTGRETGTHCPPRSSKSKLCASGSSFSVRFPSRLGSACVPRRSWCRA